MQWNRTLKVLLLIDFLTILLLMLLWALNPVAAVIYFFVDIVLELLYIRSKIKVSTTSIDEVRE